jgi:periplasmic protein TonB
MFEQAILNTRRRPWTLAVSLSLQSAAAGAVVLLSIITIDRLPAVVLPLPLPPMPAAPKPVEIVATEIVRTARTQMAGVFTAPVRIPRQIAMIVEDVSAAAGVVGAVGGLAGTGLPGGLYAGPSIYSPEQFAPAPPPSAPKPAEMKPAAPTKMLTLGGNVLEGKLVKRVIPAYPVLARNMRVSGTVKLHAIVARDGTVRELKVISGHPLLVQAAVEAVRQWLYQPTLLNGEPVEVNAPVDVHFTLAP